ncbi:hypothetical protein ACX9MO_03635 [Pseudooceanicola sp. 502str34]
MFRKLIPLALCMAAAACTNPNDMDGTTPDLGDFLLGHNIVVASKAQEGPMSRTASEAEWKTAMTDAMQERFGRYDGDHYYHIGTSIEGYVLAQPGIPLVLSPKSILLVNVTVWDDELGKKLNEKPHTISVIETFGGHSIMGSGYTMEPEEQMRGLARNAAKEIERWMLENREWFGKSVAPTSLKAPAPAASMTAGTTAATTASPAAPAATPTPAASTATTAVPAATTPTPGAQAVFAPAIEPEVLGPNLP